MNRLRSALLSLGLLLAASAAQAQTNVKADIPFDFVVGNQSMPAGEYTVVAQGSGSPAISDRRAGPAKLVISNSSIVNNPGVGILVAPASGVIGVELDHVRSAYNTYGLAVASGGRVMIKNSVFTGNSIAGIQADGGATVSVSATEVSYNSTGIGANGTVMLSNANITSNSLAINGPTQSLGNNLIFANSVDGTTPTIIAAR